MPTRKRTIVAAAFGIALAITTWAVPNPLAPYARHEDLDDLLSFLPAWLPIAFLVLAFPIGLGMARVVDERFRWILYYGAVYVVGAAATLAILQAISMHRFEAVYAASMLGWLGVAIGTYRKMCCDQSPDA